MARVEREVTAAVRGEPCFRILGHLEVELGGERLDIGGRLKRALLVDLLLHPNEVLSVDRLIDDLWADSPPSDPLNTLQVYVGQLRRLLEPNRQRRERAAVLVSDPPGYRIAVDRRSLDTLAFEHLVDAGRQSLGQGEHARAGELLHEALSLWRGPALAEFADAAFARGRLARLEEARATAFEERLETDLALGRHREIAAELEELTRRYPFRERLWELRMLALFGSSRSADALRTFQDARRVLGEELGLEPGAALVELDRRIAARDPSLNATVAPGGRTKSERPSGRDRLVGRQAELVELQAALQHAMAGTRSVVLVTGEPGAGKSRLAAELAERAWAGGCHVVSGVCLEGASPPFAPVLDCVTQIVGTVDASALDPLKRAAAVIARIRPELHGVLGDLPDPPQLPPDEDRTRLFDAVARLVVAGTAAAPMVLVLDDLQWADPTTIALTQYVVKAAARSPLLFVGCYRAGELDPGSQLAAGLHALEREAATRTIELSPLPEQEAVALVRDLVGRTADGRLVQAIVEKGGGNPFFLRELAQEASESRLEVGVPAGAREVVIRRIERLPDPCQRLAVAASVCDSPFELSVATSVAELSDAVALDALDTLVTQGLVVTTGDDSCRFSHDIVREALYEHLSGPRRARLHRAVAETMEGWSEERQAKAAASLAAHYRRSSRLPGAERGADHAERAASAAEAAHAYAESAELLQLALDLLREDDGRRPLLTARLGRARIAAGAADAGVAALEHAAVATAATGGDLAAAQLLADEAWFATTLGASDAARRLAEAGLRFGPATGTLPWTILTFTKILTSGLADPEWPGIVLGTPEQLQVAAALRRYPTQSSEPLARSLLLAFESRSDVLATAPDDPGALAFWAGEYERALAVLPGLAEECENGGRVEMAIVLRCAQARCFNALGQFDEADVVFDRAAALLRRLVGPSLYASHLRSVDEERWAAIGEGWGVFRVDISEAADPRWKRWYSVVRRVSAARVLARLGDADGAIRRLEAVLAAVDAAPGWAENYARIVYCAAEVLWVTGRSDHCALLERNALDKILRPDFRYPMTDVRHALGRLAAVQGRLDEALDWFERARLVLDEQGARPLRAVVDHDAGLVALRSGSTGVASDLLNAAHQQAQALGMPGWAAAATRLLETLAPT